MRVNNYLICAIFIIINISGFDVYASDFYNEYVGFSEPDRSHIDIGDIVLDPPAGKHGVLKNIKGELYFKDGTPARFWGVNIARGAAFPDHNTAKLLASRIAFYGFNVVRFHNIDAAFEPNGIFEDIAKGSKNYDSKRTGFISPKQIDKLDYFIYQLKKRGIYVDITLLSGRRFTLRDGVKSADKLRHYTHQAGKPASMFDPQLIKLQKTFISDLLLHKNPYTDLTYANDPTIALLEIANETSLLRYWISNRLDAGVFGKGPGLPDYYKKELDIKWHGWLARESKAVGDSSIVEYKREPWRLRKAVSFKSISALIRFYRQIETDFISEIDNYIKNKIGSRALVNAGGHYFSLANLEAQSTADFTAPHYYWDPARWPEKKWDKDNFILKALSILKAAPGKDINIRNPIMDIGLQQVYGHPLIITEWNQWFPNPFSYELPLMLASYGSLQGWDGAMIFTFCRRPITPKETTRINDFFDIHSNPQQLVLNALASLLFNKRMLSESGREVMVQLDDSDVINNVVAVGSVRRPGRNWGIDGTSFLKHKISLLFGTQSSHLVTVSKHLPKQIISDTGELVWHRVKSLYTIDADNVKGAIGFLADAGKIRLSNASVSASKNGAVVLISLDGHSINKSASMLIACVGSVTNEGAVWNYPDVNWGKGPAQLKKMTGYVEFHSDSSYRVTPLDVNGKQVGDATVIKGSSNTKLSCPVNAPWAIVNRENSDILLGHK